MMIFYMAQRPGGRAYTGRAPSGCALALALLAAGLGMPSAGGQTPGPAGPRQAAAVSATNALSDAALAAALAGLTNDLRLQLWDWSGALRGSAGYKDNILLSHSNRLASPLWYSHADAMVFRLPTAGWLFDAMASGEDIRYFGGKTESSEDFVTALAELKRTFSDHWSSTLRANYVYVDEVIDLELVQPGLSGTSRAVGNALTGRWLARGDYGPNWAELEMVGTRQLFERPLDSYWQWGPKLTLGHRFATNSEVGLSYQWSYLPYDSYEQADRLGNLLTNTVLALTTHTVQLTWNQAWDRRARWHTLLTGSFDAVSDNGSDYFGYDRYSLSGRLEYKAGAWTLAGTVRGAWYDYPVQTIDAAGLIRRSKTGFGACLNAEWKLSKAFKLLASYDFERSFSNLVIDDYSVSTVSAGVQWQF